MFHVLANPLPPEKKKKMYPQSAKPPPFQRAGEKGFCSKKRQMCRLNVFYHQVALALLCHPQIQYTTRVSRRQSFSRNFRRFLAKFCNIFRIDTQVRILIFIRLAKFEGPRLNPSPISGVFRFVCVFSLGFPISKKNLYSISGYLFLGEYINEFVVFFKCFFHVDFSSVINSLCADFDIFTTGIHFEFLRFTDLFFERY